MYSVCIQSKNTHPKTPTREYKVMSRGLELMKEKRARENPFKYRLCKKLSHRKKRAQK